MNDQPTLTFFPALADSVSPLSEKASRQSDSVRLTPTPVPCSESIGPAFPITETLANGTTPPLAMCLPEGRRVSRFRLLGEERERATIAISGLQCLQLFEPPNRIGLLSKILLTSKIWFCPTGGMTWSAKAISARRLVFQLVRLDHGRLAAKEFGLWVRPMASDAIRCKKFPSWLKLHRARQRAKSRGGGASGNFEVAAEEFSALPTPHLVEWILGFPKDWTALDASEMPSSPKSRKSSRAQSTKP